MNAFWSLWRDEADFSVPGWQLLSPSLRGPLVGLGGGGTSLYFPGDSPLIQDSGFPTLRPSLPLTLRVCG